MKSDKEEMLTKTETNQERLQAKTDHPWTGCGFVIAFIELFRNS
jgi:hypothetical protein